MKLYLINYRLSWETQEEVFTSLKQYFSSVIMFKGEDDTNFLIKTTMSVDEIYKWFEKKAPYSCREIIEGKTD